MAFSKIKQILPAALRPQSALQKLKNLRQKKRLFPRIFRLFRRPWTAWTAWTALGAGLAFFSGALVLIFYQAWFSGRNSQSSGDRRPAGLSSVDSDDDENRPKQDSAESPGKMNLNVAPLWHDDLERRPRLPGAVQQRIDKQIEGEYRARMRESQQQEGKEPEPSSLEAYIQGIGEDFAKAHLKARSEEYIKRFLENAREDGYEITLDGDYNVVSVKKIP